MSTRSLSSTARTTTLARTTTWPTTTKTRLRTRARGTTRGARASCPSSRRTALPSLRRSRSSSSVSSHCSARCDASEKIPRGLLCRPSTPCGCVAVSEATPQTLPGACANPRPSSALPDALRPSPAPVRAHRRAALCRLLWRAVNCAGGRDAATPRPHQGEHARGVPHLGGRDRGGAPRVAAAKGGLTATRAALRAAGCRREDVEPAPRR
mmetsp:Transcript_13453/g.43000  ORF Transcript_13453/g.43000 Transcript_13453/m.43000 type:complete len:210 (-) Transcript_13453:141-770(-)